MGLNPWACGGDTFGIGNSANGVLVTMSRWGDLSTRSVNPRSANVYGLGSGGSYWSGVVTNTIYRRYESSFDALDDLALVKQYKTKTISENGVEKDVIDPESLPHLKGDPTEADAKLANFWDESKVSGFLLGCTKALVQRVESLEAQLEEGKELD
jgi:hypothetical protein